MMKTILTARFIISTLFLVSSSALLYYAYLNFEKGYALKQQIPSISQSDSNTMSELQSIRQVYELKSLDSNIKTLITALREILLNVTVNTDEQNNTYGIDKLGEYRDIIISGEGNYLSQAYLLSEINDKMRNYVLLNGVEATDTTITLQTRIYGKSR